MQENNFLNYLNQCDRDELLKLTDVLFTEEWKRHMVLSQPETTLTEIRSQLNLPKDYELGERINGLNSYELIDLIKEQLPSPVLIEELNQLSPETKSAVLDYKMKKRMADAVVKIKDQERVIESKESNYSKILKADSKKEIETLVLEEFEQHFDGKFDIKINGKKSQQKIPTSINIQDLNGNSIIFDFRVEKGIQDVKYNGTALPSGNYFFLFWVGDFVGMPSSERFYLLTEYNIETISPLINGFYVYDTSWWDGTKVCGVLDNSGFPVLAPQYKTIQAISHDNFQAYRINPNGELDENNQVIKEGWEYYNSKGRKISDEHGFEEREDEQMEKYYTALLTIWSEKQLFDYKKAGIKKFSVWDLDFNHIMPFLKRFMNDPLVITRYPNIKHYLINDLYVCFDNQNNGKENFGLGIDPSLNIHFNYDEE